MKHKSIYKITNSVNNKVYIGQSNCPSKRWYQHKQEAKKEQPSMVVNQAMKKYGIENFIFEVICSILPVTDETEYCKIADEFEEHFITEYQSHISFGKGYNVSNGGSTSPKSEEWKQAMRDHWADPEYREKVISKFRDTWNKKTPEELAEIAKKLSKALSGRHLSPDSEFKPGHVPSHETIQKLSESHLGQVPINKRNEIHDDRDSIIKAYLCGETFEKIAQRYNTGATVIGRIVPLELHRSNAESQLGKRYSEETNIKRGNSNRHPRGKYKKQDATKVANRPKVRGPYGPRKSKALQY